MSNKLKLSTNSKLNGLANPTKISIISKHAKSIQIDNSCSKRLFVSTSSNFKLTKEDFYKSSSIFEQFKHLEEDENEFKQKEQDDPTLIALTPEDGPLLKMLIHQTNLSIIKTEESPHSLTIFQFLTVLPRVQKYLGCKDEEKLEELGNSIFKTCQNDAQLIYRYGHVAYGLVKLTGTTYSGQEALALYQLAYQYNHSHSGYTLATLLYQGINNNFKNEEKAMKIMRELADNGHGLATVKCGMWLVQSGKVDQGLIYLRYAAEKGLDVACNQLGHIYRKGSPADDMNKGVEIDLSKAKEYYLKSSNQGNFEADFYLGQLYSDAEPYLAFKHYQKAASSGLAEAQYNLGLFYFQGSGCEKDMLMAKEFWEMASFQGFPLAKMNLAKLLIDGLAGAKDLDQAHYLLSELVEKFPNHPTGQLAKTMLNTDLFDQPIQTDHSQQKVSDKLDTKPGCNIM